MVEPFKLHPTSMSYIYKVFKHLKQLWMGIWQHIHTVTTTGVSPDLGEFTEIPMSYIYKVFEHLEQLWMGTWQHIHTVTTTDVSLDLGNFSEIIFI